MVRLIGLRPVWLPRGTLSNMARTIMVLFLWLPRLPLFACFFLWLLCTDDPFFNWISRMPSFMVISPRRFIWSNRLVLLLKVVWFGMQAMSFLIWFETVSLSLD